MAGRHGRAQLPWGKYRGVQIRLVPDAYLSFLTTSCIVSDPKWAWLKESLLAELRHRGLNAAAVADEVLSEPEDQQEALPLAAVVAEQRPRRAYAL